MPRKIEEMRRANENHCLQSIRRPSVKRNEAGLTASSSKAWRSLDAMGEEYLNIYVSSNGRTRVDGYHTVHVDKT